MQTTLESNNKGVSHFLGKNFEKAELHYKKAISEDAQNSTALNNLGLLYHHNKAYDKAIEYFEKALAVIEKDTYYLNLANTLTFMKLYQDAEQAYIKSLELNPKNGNALLSLARFYTHTGKPTKATALWETLAVSSQNAGLRLELVKNYMQIKNFEGALELLSTLQKLKENSTVYLYIGICEFHLKNYGIAERAFKRTLSTLPDHEKARHYLALTYLVKGDHNQAMNEFDVLLKLYPDNLNIRMDRITMLLNAKEYQVALMELDKVLQVEPSHEKANEYKKMVDQVQKTE